MSEINGVSNPFGTGLTPEQAGLYKGIGVSLAVASGVLIGSSFVFKKKGLLESIEKSGGVAGEGYSYLKSMMWWAGMILMIVGELCNFIAYAFTQAILITPLGALSVVISAVLSSIFLKERLTFQGKVGCFQCILGAIVIVLHAPKQSSANTTIEAFKVLALSPGFIVYASLAVTISLILVFYCGPRWGKKNMLVYISVCSLIGSISVVFTQGLGTAIVHSVNHPDENQFTHWFIYVVIVIVIVTLLVEIVYLNKALNLFNTALVTPTYYVIFTTMTIVSSIVLYRGFDASPVDVITCIIGFFTICSGVALLHNSKGESSLIGEKESAKLLDEERPRSVFQLFENKGVPEGQPDEKMEITNYHGTHNPGPADLFPAPFSGITRYTNTTKQSQSILHKSRQRSPTDSCAIQPSIHSLINRRPHSNTISVVNNIADGNEYYGWNDDKDNPLGLRDYEPALMGINQLKNEDTQMSLGTSTDMKAHSSNSGANTPLTSTKHRAQDDLNLFSSYRLKIHEKESDDREKLVHP